MKRAERGVKTWQSSDTYSPLLPSSAILSSFSLFISSHCHHCHYCPNLFFLISFLCFHHADLYVTLVRTGRTVPLSVDDCSCGEWQLSSSSSSARHARA